MENTKIKKDVQTLLNKLKKQKEKLETERNEIDSQLAEVNSLIESLEKSNTPTVKQPAKSKKHVRSILVLPQNIIDEIEQLYLEGYNRKEVKERLSVELEYITVASRYNKIKDEYELSKLHNLEVSKIRELKSYFKGTQRLTEYTLEKIEKFTQVPADIILKIYKTYKR